MPKAPSLSAILFLLVSIPAPAPGRANPSADLARLAWMAGSWSSDSAGTRIEEHWTAPLGGLMVGMHRDVVGGRAVSFEFFRIALEEGTIAYLASPRGRPATRFGLKELRPGFVAFENLEHDFPQRILYWLDSRGRLHARIEGRLDGREAVEEWSWRRDRLTGR